MSRAEVDSEELRTAARSASRAGDSLADDGAGTVLDSAAGGLAGFTSGAALTSAANTWKTRVREFSADLRSLGDRLAQAADRYEATDNDAAGGLRRILDLLNRVGVAA
ncbi:type VII secretion target [Saccharomonospora glauca]|jgi:uncharacterized protein YukE|uniref:Excreted virulence factor EspC, type VII ESX diderm n=1 Tax=Saccharomonospora glauca K62 TaxID=928724 RepID=I1D6K5_9PSEU|nr:type VII secretion target [Saccharomonospora glauca]EIF00580.1 Protein of unknown function (DUF2580) [Saccharomonospora glauca K62]